MTTILCIFIFLIGISIGSFLSVIIYRIHNEEKGIVMGRSMCGHCKKTLKPRDLIPLLSYVLAKGKCRYCHKKISPHYLFLEIATGILFLLIYFKFPFFTETLSLYGFTIAWDLLLQCVLYWIYSVFFVGIFFYDLQFMEIPDVFLFPLIGLTLLGSLLFGTGIVDLAISLGIALVFFGGQIIVSKGKWLGEGDVYLAVSMAFLFGWKLFLLAIVLTYIIGSFLSIFLIIFKKVSRQMKIPFGPFMVIGSFVTIFAGEEILNWYLQMLSF